MKTLLFRYKILAILFFAICFIWSNTVQSHDWKASFHKYRSVQKIIAPNGFLLKSNPSLSSRTIKETNSYVTIDAIGYLENLDSDRVRFYMSKWSWKRVSQGHNPNWVLIKSGGIGGKNWRAMWRDSFVKLPHIQQVYAETHMVKKVPSLYANDIKIITIPRHVNVAGYLDTGYGRFYMSDWSWRRLSEGKDPNWVYIHEYNPTSSSEHYSNTAKFNYDEPEYTTNSYSSSSYSYPPSDVYSSKRKRILKRSASALAQYASGKFIDNPVIAAAVGEAASALIEQRKFSPQEVASSAIINAFSRELKNKGHSNLGNVLDIGSTLQYILSE